MDMKIEEAIGKATTLSEALPYIKKFTGQTLLIKYGGAAMVDEQLKKDFASDVALLKFVGINPIIVHGGGKEINYWLDRLGVKSSFVDGLRYTDQDSIDIVEMVLCGSINKEIVSLINQVGGKAVGLSGKDANLYVGKQIRTKDGKDLGLVGEIETCDTGLLNVLCGQGYIPVISSVSAARDFPTLNMNADHVAAGIAKAVGALKLIYLTDVQGILIGGKFLQELDLNEAEELLKHPEITAGMRPKLEYSLHALKAGVKHVHIIDGTMRNSLLLELFTTAGIGTMISNEKIKI